jgi:TRAP-type uncharacterized transport system substrate-binding protein
MKSFKTIIAIIAISSSALSAMAQDSRIVVAADSSSGTYNKHLGEIIGVCSSDQFAIVPAQGVTGGAPGNLEALVQNKSQGAFMHSDVFLASSMADPSYKRFQTLVALWPEPIHVLTLKQTKTFRQETKKTYGGLSSETTNIPVMFNSLADTKGYTVGAAGGGIYTARVLQGQGEGGFQVQSYDKGDLVIAALEKGEIAAAIFVGAAPLPNLEKLNKAVYKLIPIGESITAKVKTVYRPASINYTGLTSGPVQTIAPLAVIMTRKYTTPERVAAQANFRSCFYKELGNLQDNASPNWQEVKADDRGTLDWYELPNVKPVVSTASSTTKKK